MRELTCALLITSSLALWACGESAPPQHLLGTPTDWSIGAQEAPVVLVEYGDYQCPPCAALHRSVTEVMERRGQQVRFVFRHYPIRRHVHEEGAAEAAEAAGAQGAFWAMHGRLFAQSSEWSLLSDPSPVFARYASELGLDGARFAADVASHRFRSRISASKDEARRLGVRRVPTLFLNGARVWNVPRGPEALDALLADALRRSVSSGGRQ